MFYKTRKIICQCLVYLFLAVITVLTLLPLYLTILLSLKSNADMTDFILAFPEHAMWVNYANGFTSMIGNLLNSVAVSVISTLCFIFLSSLCGYVFSRYEFPLKNTAFMYFIALLVFPGVLSLTPQYILFVNLGLKDNWLALILPYSVSGLAGAIFLFRSFFEQQPLELFEAGRLDGANDFVLYFVICLPLAIPVLIVQALGTFGGIYNDYLWPTMIIENTGRQLIIPMLNSLTQSTVGSYQEQGVRYALYLMSGIPLIFTTLGGLKFFIDGDFASGMKL